LKPFPLWRWAALLGIALVAPAGLPAGGADRRLPEVRRRMSAKEPVLTATSSPLRCAPQHQAPTLLAVAADSPLRVLRSWWEPTGQRWLLVEGVGPEGARRGWLAG
jgi:hypothetical protein